MKARTTSMWPASTATWNGFRPILSTDLGTVKAGALALNGQRGKVDADQIAAVYRKLMQRIVEAVDNLKDASEGDTMSIYFKDDTTDFADTAENVAKKVKTIGMNRR